jgi:Na+/proline symporter
MIRGAGLAEVVFALTLIATFVAAVLARRHSALDHGDELAGHRLNRWLIGLSAGTTANSGFIVTAAVGLGYTYGLKWVLLPVSWLLGDLIFWYFFPSRINQMGHDSHATTLSELLRDRLSGPLAPAIAVLSALVILTCLSGYTSAQWLAGQKFLAGAFGLPDYIALSLFALLIIVYSSIGGFRGSIYTDTLQAFIRIIGTIIALTVVTWFAMSDASSFSQHIAEAGDSFLNPFPGGTIPTVFGFVAGFAAAAIGFGLGQPQIISRYLAGSSPKETRSAWWIYMGFVQFTWIAMTVFGMILRGVMPAIPDPETGLSVFFQQNAGAVATGIIVADVFATIAATSNGLLIAMAQAANHDLLPRLFGSRSVTIPLAATTLVIGAITMVVSVLIHGSVLTVALSSVSMMGAGLAGPVMIKVLRWPHTGASLLISICTGLGAAAIWRYSGMSGFFNEAGVGIAAGLIANWLTIRSRSIYLLAPATSTARKGK